jgi:hypothetical protein
MCGIPISFDIIIMRCLVCLLTFGHYFIWQYFFMGFMYILTYIIHT